MSARKPFEAPQLTEYGALSDIIRMPHQGTPHKTTLPPGLQGRLNDPCNDGEGPKQAAKADANWTCGSAS